MNQKKSKLIKKFVSESYGNRQDYQRIKKEHLQMDLAGRTKETAKMKEILSDE